MLLSASWRTSTKDAVNGKEIPKVIIILTFNCNLRNENVYSMGICIYLATIIMCIFVCSVVIIIFSRLLRSAESKVFDFIQLEIFA